MINVKRFLEENSDFSYAQFNKKLIETQYPILGVRLPTLRKFAKEIEPEYIDFEDNLCHEMILLYAFSASFCKTEDEQLEYLQNLLPYIDNWCTCDCSLQSLKRLNGEKSYSFFNELLKDSRPFYVRAGIIGLMRYFMKTEKLDEILKNFKLIKNENYYVKMALAWFYAEVCTYNYEKAKKEISAIEDKFIRNKAISKARESYRIDKDKKDELNDLKI